MQLVKEHINFERGLDPKTAMDIGDPHTRKMEKIERIMIKLANQFGAINLMLDPQGDFYSFDYNEYTYLLGLQPSYDKNDPDNHSHEYSVSYEPANAPHEGITSENYEQQDAETLEEAEQILKEWLVYRTKSDELLPTYKTNESVNFQRGLNPKDAMGIGDIKKREQDRVRKIMRNYMNKAMKENDIHDRLKFKKNDKSGARRADLENISYSFKIQKEKFELKYYYNNHNWDLELNYGGMKRYINLPTTTIKDFAHVLELAILDLDLYPELIAQK